MQQQVPRNFPELAPHIIQGSTTWPTVLRVDRAMVRNAGPIRATINDAETAEYLLLASAVPMEVRHEELDDPLLVYGNAARGSCVRLPIWVLNNFLDINMAKTRQSFVHFSIRRFLSIKLLQLKHQVGYRHDFKT